MFLECFQVVKSTSNVLDDIEHILGENVVANKSLIEIRVLEKPFHPSDLFPKRMLVTQN